MDRLRGWWTPRLQALHLDLTLAGGATGIEIGLLSDSLGAPGTPPAVIPVAVSVVAGVLLFFYRRAPLVVLAAILVLEGVLAYIGSYPGGAPALVALALVGLHEERRRSVPALVVTAIVLQVGSISAIPVSVLAWAAGAYLQTRLRYVATLSQRAEQLEREREQRDLIAAQAERTAIARELHDIVAHSVTVMLLGVRGARDSVRSNPDLAEEALRRVEKSGEESMAELRRMLFVLRAPMGDAVGEAALTPAPAVVQIPDLVAQHREAGMPVVMSTHGAVRPTDAGIELAAYRIVQEGLTNVARHAGSVSRVEVALRYDEECLHVSIEDDGQGSRGNDAGHGLRGLRERVAVVGGQLNVTSLKGFRLDAELPLTGSEIR
jgi:signal transduction histidine kinase